MAEPKEIPELATELFDMSKEYLLQETVEPAKRLGRYAGFGIAGAVVVALASVFLILGVYALFQFLLPDDNEWFIVLARGLTVVVAGAAAGIVAWRMAS